jgi:hypothetical protein
LYVHRISVRTCFALIHLFETLFVSRMMTQPLYVHRIGVLTCFALIPSFDILVCFSLI